MKQHHIAVLLLATGAVIFIVDAIAVARGGPPVFLHSATQGDGMLAGLQSFIPVPLDLGLMAAGAALLVF